jgi:hypothetical protein
VTKAAAVADRRIDLRDAFIDRAWACAYLWAVGEYNLHVAVDVLQHDAECNNLIDRIGQDAVQKILSDAFAPYHFHEDVAAYAAPTVAPKPGKRTTPRTTIEAIMWCIRERGPQALHEPANIERLSRCDESAISEIDRRIAKLEATNAS